MQQSLFDRPQSFLVAPQWLVLCKTRFSSDHWPWERWKVGCRMVVSSTREQVVKVIWHKTALPPQTDGSIVFARWRQCALHVGALAPPGKYDWTCASFCLPKSTTQMENRSVQPCLHKTQHNVIGQIFFGTTWRIQANSWFLQPTHVHNPIGRSIGSAVSPQLTAGSPYTLQWATLSPKTAPSHGGICTPI